MLNILFSANHAAHVRKQNEPQRWPTLWFPLKLENAQLLRTMVFSKIGIIDRDFGDGMRVIEALLRAALHNEWGYNRFTACQFAYAPTFVSFDRCARNLVMKNKQALNF